MGVAPTWRDLVQRAPAIELEPTIRWMWEVESTAVRSFVVAAMSMGREGLCCMEGGDKIDGGWKPNGQGGLRTFNLSVMRERGRMVLESKRVDWEY